MNERGQTIARTFDEAYRKLLNDNLDVSPWEIESVIKLSMGTTTSETVLRRAMKKRKAERTPSGTCNSCKKLKFLPSNNTCIDCSIL